MTTKFIGQKIVRNKIELLLPEVMQTHQGKNFLLRAPSGWGKTILGLKMCNYLCPDRKFSLKIMGEEFEFEWDKWVHFLDEIHFMQSPEVLYPLMDSGKYVFILASNETGNLKEALINRCENLIFSPYSDNELVEMVEIYCNFRPTLAQSFILITACGGNPRIINKTIQNLNLWYRTHGNTDVERFLSEFMGYKDGLDILSYQYVEFLKRIGGKASIDTISANLHVDKNTLFYQVEPILLYQRKIKISSKGRELCP